MMSDDRAVALARKLARYHAGVIIWTRFAKPDEGEFGEPNVLFRAGDVPEMD